MDQNGLLDKLNQIAEHFDEVQQLLAKPDAMQDMKRFVALNKEYRDLEPLMALRKEYAELLSNVENTKAMLAHESDEELHAMAKEELENFTAQVEPLEERIKLQLLPQDPQDSKNAIVEIRGGAGGDEASIFAGDLFRMYEHYAESQGWKLEVSSSNEGTAGASRK